MELTRDEVVSALREVGQRLLDRKKIGDIAIFGGSALLLQFDVSFTTQDVDAVIEGDHGDVERAVQEVGRRRGWPRSWLNEGVSVYLGTDPRKHVSLYASYPTEERVGLRVYVAKPQYILALKLRAMRTDTRDIDDVIMLARHLGLRTLDDLRGVLASHFPHEALDARRIMILSDVVTKL